MARPVPVTPPLWTSLDCARTYVPVDSLRQALRRGLIAREELRAALAQADLAWRAVA